MAGFRRNTHLETIPALSAKYSSFFYFFEVFSVVLFSVEYAVRLWSIVENEVYRAYGPISSRLRFMLSPMAIVDFVAIAPFYLPLLTTVDLRTARILRLFRLFRLFKIGRSSDVIERFQRVFQHKSSELLLSLYGSGILLIFVSSIMYYVEHDAQPEAFGSIPETMWWGVATSTTVGYGDVYPITPLGRFLGALVALLGVSLFALPAGVLASGFSEAASKNDGNCPECNRPFDSDT